MDCRARYWQKIIKSIKIIVCLKSLIDMKQ